MKRAMAYPSIQQYQEALQHPSTAFSDAALARGKIRSSGLGTPIVVSGGFALTYAVESSGTKYAVRCFHREAKGLERRYGATVVVSRSRGRNESTTRRTRPMLIAESATL